MSKQLNIALYQAKIGERIHSGWGLANVSSNNTYNINKNCCVILSYMVTKSMVIIII
jgi:hypothetical protein